MDAVFSLSARNGILILTVHDLLSELSNREIMEAVEAKIADGYSRFVVDLSSAEYMNSLGINFLIKMKHRSKELGGRLAVCNASQKVKQLLDITKLRPMFILADSLDEALAFLKE